MSDTRKMYKRRAALVTALLAGQVLPCFAQQGVRLEPYVSESRAYAIHKPAAWTVMEEQGNEDLRILVRSPDGASSVDFYFAMNGTGRADAAAFLAEYRRRLMLSCRELAFSEAYVSQDGARALTTVRCRMGTGNVKGRYYFESNATGVSAQGYLAPEPQLAAQRPLLLNMMASLAFSKSRKSQAGGAPVAMKAEPPVRVALTARRAQDGSLGLRVPQDWTFAAAGGKVVSGAPDGSMGFIFTAVSGNPMLPNASIAQGVLGTAYRPPPQALGMFLQAFGHRNIKILSANPDQATMQECLAGMGRRCDAQDLVARWTSSAGADCVGAIKMVNAAPSASGMWFFIVSGIWGPERDFERYYPMLEEVGSSFGINDQYAKRYIQSGLENLRRLQAQTAAAMQDLNRAREQNQRDWEARQERKDYMNSKWDDYRRGNSYWVSDLEGGKIYKTDTYGTRDTVTGDYYGGQGYNWVNFEGQNPRHPSENMRELSSWEMENGRRPPR